MTQFSFETTPQALSGIRQELVEIAAVDTVSTLQNLLKETEFDLDSPAQTGKYVYASKPGSCGPSTVRAKLVEVSAEAGNIEMVKELMQGSDALGKVAMKAAARNGHVDILRHLVKDGLVNTTQPVKTNDFPLQDAVRNDQLPAARYLISVFREIEDINVNDSYCLRTAAAHGDIEMVNLLVDQYGDKLDFTAQDNYAIRHAATNGHLDVVRLLLVEGTDIDLTARDHAALKGALQNGSLSIAHALLTNSDFILTPSVLDELKKVAAPEVATYMQSLGPLAEACETIQETFNKLGTVTESFKASYKRSFICFNDHSSPSR